MGQNGSYNQSQGAIVECMCLGASGKWSQLYMSKIVSLLWGDYAGQKWSWGRSHGLSLVEQQELGLMNSAVSKHKILDFFNRPESPAYLTLSSAWTWSSLVSGKVAQLLWL